MSRTAVIITSQDHGRRMSLAEFDHAEAQEGRLYELGRGEVIVTDVPNPEHMFCLHAVREQLYPYLKAHRDVIRYITTGSECKILVEGYESERHPDMAIYKTAPPSHGSEVWSMWVPEIVIEIVSVDSEHRDYREKPEEYLAFGILEYWIIDPRKQLATILRRSRGRWARTELGAAETYKTPLLPGFTLYLGPVFVKE